jgi:hypothetical protein
MRSNFSFERYIPRSVIRAVVAAALSVTLGACATEEPQGYRFDVVNQPVPVSAHSEITVRLVDVSNGEPVSDARILKKQLQRMMWRPRVTGKGRSPASVSEPMGEDVKYIGPVGSGLYRFLGDVSMPGKWTLGLSANVPGEAGPVSGAAKFTASHVRQDP